MNKEVEKRLRREDFDHDMWEKRLAYNRGMGKGEIIEIYSSLLFQEVPV